MWVVTVTVGPEEVFREPCSGEFDSLYVLKREATKRGRRANVIFEDKAGGLSYLWSEGWVITTINACKI